MQLLDLERYVPLERCRLVRYDDYSETLDQSFEEQEVGGRRRGRGGRGGEEEGGERRRGMGNKAGRREGWMHNWKGGEEGRFGMSVRCDIVLLSYRTFH